MSAHNDSYSLFFFKNIGILQYKNIKDDISSEVEKWDEQFGQSLPMVEIELAQLVLRQYFQVKLYDQLLDFYKENFPGVEIEEFPYKGILEIALQDNIPQLIIKIWNIIISKRTATYRICRRLWCNFDNSFVKNDPDARLRTEKLFIKKAEHLIQALSDYIEDLQQLNQMQLVRKTNETLQKVKSELHKSTGDVHKPNNDIRVARKIVIEKGSRPQTSGP